MGIDLHTLVQAETVRVFKQDARTRVWQAHGPDGPVVVKRFEYWPLRQLAGRLLGIHPGQFEQRRIRLLERVGVSAAPIIASGVINGRYHLVTPFIGPSVQQVLFEGRLDRPRMEAIADLVQGMLSSGLFNPDLKVSNILIDRHDRAHLIDVGKVRRSSSDRNRSRMLAMLFHTLEKHGITPQQKSQLMELIARRCRSWLPDGPLDTAIAAIGLE
jgi:tRNA A-37 threonylcarbamoyl transferase component Bud32